MKKEFFTKDDFEYLTLTRETAARNANEKLAKLIESWPVVFGTNGDSPGGWTTIRDDDEETWYPDTHQARLAFIEEIKKEPCKHEPIMTVRFPGFDRSGTHFKSVPELIECKHCGVKLQGTWTEVKK